MTIVTKTVADFTGHSNEQFVLLNQAPAINAFTAILDFRDLNLVTSAMLTAIDDAFSDGYALMYEFIVVYYSGGFWLYVGKRNPDGYSVIQQSLQIGVDIPDAYLEIDYDGAVVAIKDSTGAIIASASAIAFQSGYISLVPFSVDSANGDSGSATLSFDFSFSPQLDVASQYIRRGNVNPLHNYADVTNTQDALGQLMPQTLILQDLIGLYHLFEGTGTVANDSAPVNSPNNGTISAGIWAQGPVTKVLEFAGNGSVDCSNVNDITKGGNNSAFSIGGWFSPFAYGDNQNRIISRSGQYLLQQVGYGGAVQFGVYINGDWVYLQSDDNVAPLNSRCFALGVYDGENMFLYVANPLAVNQLLTYTQAQTGVPNASTNPTLIGEDLNGAVSECMIWARALSGQEALELFFRPLFRIVAKGVTTLDGNADVGDVLASKTFYKNDPWTKLTGTLVESPINLDNVIDGCSFNFYNTYEDLTIVHPSNTVNRVSATFQSFYSSPSEGYFQKIIVRLYKVGTPTGNLKCALYSHSGTYGSSSLPNALLETSSTVVDVSTIPPAWTTYIFTFAGTTQLTANTPYVIVLWLDSGSYTTSNKVIVQGVSAKRHTGNWGNYQNSSWHYFAYDLCFFALKL